VRIIDSHVHFWRIGAPGRTWPDAQLPVLYRDFGPADLQAAQSDSYLSHTVRTGTANSAFELVGVVLVQSQPDDRDTDWLLEIAADMPLVKAVVGWVDLASPSAPARIDQLARRPKLRGLRPMLQSIDDTQWLLRSELEPALRAMVQQGLRFDALIQPRHLPMLAEFARRWPDLPTVIDHGAKPRIAHAEIEPWRTLMTALGRFSHVHCKLSGLRTEQANGAPAHELEPYIRHLGAVFADRLMWGSDWPVLLHSNDKYEDWLNASLEWAARASPEVTPDSLFYGAAKHFYRLE
jgi:L-fuconolactonase